MSESGSLDLDRNTINQILAGEVRKILQGPLAAENHRLRRKLEMTEAELSDLRLKNSQFREGVWLAVDLIEQLHSESARELLGSLGIPEEVLQNQQHPQRDELVKALRRTLMLTHPDRHSQEPPLVQRALNYIVKPVTRTLNLLKRPQ